MNDSTSTRLRREARKLFAHNGFDATSVRQITAAAEANLGAVTYHYQSKEALYHAILAEVFDDLAARIEAAAGTDGAPDQRMGAVVNALFAFFRDVPDAPLLVIREVAGGATPPAPVIPRIRRVVRAIAAVISAGRDAGTFRDVEPFLGTFTLISQCVWFAVVGRHMPVVLGAAAAGPDLGARMQAHITDVVRRSMAAEGTDA